MTDSADLKNIPCKAVDTSCKDLHELSHDTWSHPELCFEEHHAHDTLTSFLEEKAGFPNVGRKFVMDTGFRAVYGAIDKPHVAVLCEYDALPEIGHACGHNLIAEAGVAAGIGIKAAMDDARMDGKDLRKVTILGTPAEEGGGGNIDMINAGVFKEMDAVMMVHPSVCDRLYQDCFTAVQRVNIKNFGKASHAAGFPWEGVNALDAAVMAYNNISVMRQQCKPAWRIHGVICNGGVKSSIIPEETHLEYNIRAPTMKELGLAQAKVVQCFEAAAKATGCKMDINWHPKPYANVITNPTLARLFESNVNSLGVHYNDPRPSSASTDFGNVSYVVPGIHPEFGIKSTVPQHNKEFAAAAASAQPLTLGQAKAMAMTAIDIYCQPQLVDTIHQEFITRIERYQPN